MAIWSSGIELLASASQAKSPDTNYKRGLLIDVTEIDVLEVTLNLVYPGTVNSGVQVAFRKSATTTDALWAIQFAADASATESRVFSRDVSQHTAVYVEVENLSTNYVVTVAATYAIRHDIQNVMG